MHLLYTQILTLPDGFYNFFPGKVRIVCTIRLKQKDQKKGKMVPPWSGPNKETYSKFPYISKDTPCFL